MFKTCAISALIAATEAVNVEHCGRDHSLDHDHDHSHAHVGHDHSFGGYGHYDGGNMSYDVKVNHNYKPYMGSTTGRLGGYGGSYGGCGGYGGSYGGYGGYGRGW